MGTMNRLAADIVELSGTALNIAQAAASRIAGTTEGAGRNLEQARQGLMSVAGAKPGIPAAK